MENKIKRLFCQTFVSLLFASAAHAQNIEDRQTDKITSQIDARRGIEGPTSRAVTGESPWYLTVGAALHFNSNIANDATGGQAAFYIDPSLAVGSEWALGSATLSAEVGGDSQFFTAHTSNNNATAYANVRLALNSGPIKPYADYIGLSIHDGFFDSHAVTLHQFTLGAITSVPIGQSSKLSFNLAGVRREATLPGSELNRAELTNKFVTPIRGTTDLVLVVQGRLNDFSGGTNTNRTDRYLKLGATIKGASKGFDWEFGVTFERNWSNTASFEYSTWDIGPTITRTF